MSELGDKIKKIHKELDDMTPAENLVVANDIIDELLTINNSLRAENAKLREALKKYGMHGCPCAWHTSQHDDVCDCGLHDALKDEAEPAGESPDIWLCKCGRKTAGNVCHWCDAPRSESRSLEAPAAEPAGHPPDVLRDLITACEHLFDSISNLMPSEVESKNLFYTLMFNTGLEIALSNAKTATEPAGEDEKKA